MGVMLSEDEAPTTRKFPRTLAQAFPRDHAWAVEHYAPPVRSVLGGWVRVVVCVVGFVGFGIVLVRAAS